MQRDALLSPQLQKEEQEEGRSTEESKEEKSVPKGWAGQVEEEQEENTLEKSSDIEEILKNPTMVG